MSLNLLHWCENAWDIFSSYCNVRLRKLVLLKTFTKHRHNLQSDHAVAGYFIIQDEAKSSPCLAQQIGGNKGTNEGMNLSVCICNWLKF